MSEKEEDNSYDVKGTMTKEKKDESLTDEKEKGENKKHSEVKEEANRSQGESDSGDDTVFDEWQLLGKDFIEPGEESARSSVSIY